MTVNTFLAGLPFCGQEETRRRKPGVSERGERANFTGLVNGCIEAKFCNKIFVGKLLTRSTRFTRFYTFGIQLKNHESASGKRPPDEAHRSAFKISAKFRQTFSHFCNFTLKRLFMFCNYSPKITNFDDFFGISTI